MLLNPRMVIVFTSNMFCCVLFLIPQQLINDCSSLLIKKKKSDFLSTYDCEFLLSLV